MKTNLHNQQTQPVTAASARRTKLTYVIDVLDTNLAGTENQLIRMINGMDKGAFEVSLLCLRDHPWFSQHGPMLDCAKTVIPIQSFASPSTYLSIARLVSYFRRTRPDVVHTFFPVANIVAVIAARLAGVPMVISSRRDFGEWMTPRYLMLTKLANRFAHRIVSNAHQVKKLTVEREGVPLEKADVIFNGIDHTSYAGLKPDTRLKRELGIPESNRVVGIVANFRPMKHHETFIRAAAEVLKDRHDVSFLLIGGIPSTMARKQALEELGRSLGIGNQLCFAGAQQDVKPYLSIMDVAVNCSEQEGLSNAIMEYMACGIPAIVSRSGGNTDLITHDVHGFTFELDDHRELAQHITRLLNDDLLCRRLGENARHRIEQEMADAVMLQCYAVLYRQRSQRQDG